MSGADRAGGDMTVILVNPRMPDVKPYEAVCPLNLLCLAAALRRDLGVTPVVVDLALSADGTQPLADLLASRPAVVGFGTMTVAVPETLRLARLVKALSPQTAVVVGGVHATIAPLDLIAEPAVDYVLRGEADGSLVALVAALGRGEAPAGIAGLVTRETAPAAAAPLPPAPTIRDLDTLAFPAFDLVDLSRYEQAVAIVSSRGCPYDCVYCSAAEISGRSWRGFSVERLVDDIARLVTGFGVQRISFSDDLFTLNAKRVRAVCDALADRGLRFEWSCLARPDRVDTDLLSTMRAAGCVRVYFGAESVVEGSLQYAGRRYAAEEVARAVACAREAGIDQVVTSFIIGFPGETVDDVRATLRFADSLDAFIQVHALTPFPGTPLSRNLDAAGVTVCETDYATYNCQRAVIATEHLSNDALRGLLAEGLMLCYEHNRDRSAATLAAAG